MARCDEAFANVAIHIAGGAVLSAFDAGALTLLFLIGLLVAIMLWPYYNYTFRFDPKKLPQDFVDQHPPATVHGIHRALALRIKSDMASNWRIIQRLRVALQLALFLWLLDLLAWLFAIARI
ncbi:hypothetical protein NKJ72_27750 [Mesorhizobium sp. M0045]|uniref:hypothetical protein n=1 Tax=Mesorhizobium sp. M0045 TaxID=2956857 RepID=UPI003337E1FA